MDAPQPPPSIFFPLIPAAWWAVVVLVEGRCCLHFSSKSGRQVKRFVPFHRLPLPRLFLSTAPTTFSSPGDGHRRLNASTGLLGVPPAFLSLVSPSPPSLPIASYLPETRRFLVRRLDANGVVGTRRKREQGLRKRSSSPEMGGWGMRQLLVRTDEGNSTKAGE